MDMSDARTFVDKWSTVWNGADTDPSRYMDLLHAGCPLINPINEIRREDLPEFMAAVLDIEPDIRVKPFRWAATEDAVLIEWVNRGTVSGQPFELWGADRYTLRDGKGVEGYSYFDPRPMLERQAARSANGNASNTSSKRTVPA